MIDTWNNSSESLKDEVIKYFKEGSNEKSLIKYEKYDDYLCFWRCLSYHQMNPKPEDPRNINKKMKQLFNDYYNKQKDIKNYNGVEFVVEVAQGHFGVLYRENGVFKTAFRSAPYKRHLPAFKTQPDAPVPGALAFHSEG